MQDKENAPVDRGFAGVLVNAYRIDALLDRVILQPLNSLTESVLGRGVDRGIDRLYSGSGTLLTRMAGLVGTRVQDGDVGKYAWLVAAGAVLMLAGLYFS